MPMLDVFVSDHPEAVPSMAPARADISASWRYIGAASSRRVAMAMIEAEPRAVAWLLFRCSAGSGLGRLYDEGMTSRPATA